MTSSIEELKYRHKSLGRVMRVEANADDNMCMLTLAALGKVAA